jgi:hypothetical protein
VYRKGSPSKYAEAAPVKPRRTECNSGGKKNPAFANNEFNSGNTEDKKENLSLLCHIEDCVSNVL